MRIAMWSGPRNLSTAMMYSFGNRPDCAVVDEPFYASYLAMTGLQHPMQQEILASQPQDPDVVAKAMLDVIPDCRSHYYMKLMTHHMIPGVPRDWMKDCVNVFLIRHPARVIASYGIKRENPTLDDIGFPQQAELFDLVRSWGQDAIVMDSHDIRDDPEGMLRSLCDRIGLSFDDTMLSWPKGGHKDDGAWASHWYESVWNSTGFAGAEGALPEVSAELKPVLDAAVPFYEKLSRVKLCGWNP